MIPCGLSAVKYTLYNGTNRSSKSGCLQYSRDTIHSAVMWRNSLLFSRCASLSMVSRADNSSEILSNEAGPLFGSAHTITWMSFNRATTLTLPEEFPSKTGYIIPPAYSGSASGLFPVGHVQNTSPGRCPGGILLHLHALSTPIICLYSESIKTKMQVRCKY